MSATQLRIMIIIMILKLIVSYYHTPSTAKWSVKELSQAFIDTGKPLVYDPEAVLSIAEVLSLEQQIKASFSRGMFNLVVVRQVDFLNENQHKKVSFEIWAEIFTQLALQEKQKFDRNIMALYSIKDRLWRVRTGELLMIEFPNKVIYEIGNSLKTKLKKERYSEAFSDLIDDLAHKERYMGWRFYHTVLVILLIVGFGACIRMHFKSKAEDKVKKVFKTYRQIKTENKDFKAFMQENCVICLEPLKTTMDSNTGNIKEQLVDSKDESVFLECGHNFHRECIKEMLQKNNRCPICRQNVDTTSYEGLGTALRLVQRERFGFHLRPREVDLLYINPYFTSNLFTHRAAGGNVAYGGARSGGATGGW